MVTCIVKTSKIHLAALVMTMLATPAFAATIVGSYHDFSLANASVSTPFAGVWDYTDPDTGFPRTIDEVCVFCHTPHGASTNVPGTGTGPLWNRSNSNYTYTMYSSATLSATVSAAPTGSSAMCMSCHDGVTSIAVNTLLNGPGSGNPVITNTTAVSAMGDIYNGGLLPFGPNIGENYPGSGSSTIILSNDHPVSFDWPSGMTGTKLYDPSSIDPALRLFGAGLRVECATCHTVHDPTNVPFLAMPNTNSNMCRSCHIK